MTDFFVELHKYSKETVCQGFMSETRVFVAGALVGQDLVVLSHIVQHEPIYLEPSEEKIHDSPSFGKTVRNVCETLKEVIGNEPKHSVELSSFG